MPTSYIATLKQRKLIAEQTLEFVLQRPVGFEFQAGQNVNLKLTDLTFEDARHGRRTLTIASPPSASDLKFATRYSQSGFKRTLLEGPLQEIEITGPRGNMLHDVSNPAVFIAGGIGITPFKSMILEAIEKSITKKMTLIYSNKTLVQAAYHALFVKLAEKHNFFEYLPTLTAESPASDWSGERRRVSAAFLKDHNVDFQNSRFYLCGVPPMVDALVELLKTLGVGEENILSESFWGYKP